MQPRERLLSYALTNLEHFLKFFDQIIEENNFLDAKKSQQEFRAFQIAEYLCEILQELNKTQWLTLWQNVKNFSEDALRKFASNTRAVLDNDEADSGTTILEKGKDSTDLLQCVSYLCLAAVKMENPYICDDLWSVVLILHGSLLSFSSMVPALAFCICKLCIEWWHKGLPGKDSVCTNAIVYLLNEVLQSGLNIKPNSSSKLTSQLYKLEKAFATLDFEEGCANDGRSDAHDADAAFLELRQLLISSFLHPAFLKTASGRKFLAKIMLLQKELMIAIHQTIMNNLLTKFSYSEVYGNIYYLAWNLADDQTKEKLEECCIQDVMFRAMNASRTTELFTGYQRILLSISAHNGALHVRHMMTRLYNPIIWRSLKASNAMVRANAACLLFDSFPLVNAPDGDGDDRDAFLQKQFTTIEELLEDPYPQVRTIAVTGMFNILNLYWDVIPSEVIALQCKKLYTSLAFDASSITVRLAVFKGTLVLLNNPCSHPLLQKLLPVVGRCIHDSSEKVRLAVCKVLLAVKQTSTIQFWNVCSVENILAQLEVEGQTGSKHLVNLISGSFLPQNDSPETWAKRCVNFYQRNTGAARKFYLLVKDRLSVTELGEFMFTLSVFIFNVVSKSFGDESQEQVDTDAGDNIAEEPGIIAGLLDTICILWTEFNLNIKSLSKSKEKSSRGKESTNHVRELTKKVMVQLPRMSHVCFRKYHDDRSLNALLYLSSCLQPASMPIFSKKVIPKLKSLPEDSPSSYYEMLIQCVTKWGWSKELLEIILQWFAAVINNDKDDPQMQNTDPSSSSKKSGRKAKQKKTKGKSVQFTEEVSAPRPRQGIKYLAALVKDEDTLNGLLSDQGCRGLLDEVTLCLQSFTTLLLSRLEDSATAVNDVTDQQLFDSFSLYCKLLAHSYLFCNNKEGNDGCNADAHSFLQKLDSTFEHSRLRIVEQLKSTAQLRNTLNSSVLSTTLQDVNISQQLDRTSVISKLSFVKDFLQANFDSMLYLLQHGVPLADQALAFVVVITDTGVKTLDFAASIIALLHEIFECLLLYSWLDNEERTKQEEDEATLLQVIDDVMLSLTTYSRSNPDGFAVMFRTQLRSNVKSLVHVSSKYSNGITKKFYADLMRKIITAVLADITYRKLTASSPTFLTYNHFADLPPFSAALLPVTCPGVTSCQYICRNTIIDIFNDFASDDTNQKELAEKACILLLKVLINDGKDPSAAKRCLEMFQQKPEDNNLSA